MTESQVINAERMINLGHHHFANFLAIIDLCNKSMYTKTLGLRSLRTWDSQPQRITHRLCIKREERTFTMKKI